jgi:hypothetical protein
MCTMITFAKLILRPPSRPTAKGHRAGLYISSPRADERAIAAVGFPLLSLADVNLTNRV